MVVDTLAGYNTAGRAGPSGTSVVFALDLTEVSTIQGSATQQLTLSDLGTDCPKSEHASFIATAPPDGRCRPVLAAPPAVKSWVSPCNGCGNFGLFDPPYAVPTLEGGLVPAPVTTSTSEPETKTVPTAAPTTSLSPAEETTSSPFSAPSSTEEATSSDQPAPFTTSSAAPTTSSNTSSTTASGPSSASGSSISASAPAFTGSAAREMPGLAWMVMGFLASAYLI
ncbi:uncharacterized protein BDW47DRAFT_45166 [Aspergillus candidus]|uniref:Uncharacterized protein n=1 Tax=Aspergillus candidus TaxID=41067 RepID=A0A2I2F8W3_ASPCN|nr:hypothetical protein BDW47DRAFT_45166 [Aspergillus candidus]PLB37072.1 hypothetical protein BDW47DRAFT_45166 [Aspergillus candidus]